MSLPGHVALSLVHAGTLGVEQVKCRALPKSVVDVCRVVYQAKCSLIKVRRARDSSFCAVQMVGSMSLSCLVISDLADAPGAGPFLQGGLRTGHRTFEVPL